MLNSKIKLLVIDDDDINIFIIKKIIEKTGYDVEMEARNNGQLAIDYLEELRSTDQPMPQLVLIDINMPVLNGWEFIEAFEKMSFDGSIYMYMLSSSVYENDIEKAKSYKSVDGFISKPLHLERLKELFSAIEL